MKKDSFTILVIASLLAVSLYQNMSLNGSSHDLGLSKDQKMFLGNLFQKWADSHNKSYNNPQERQFRFKIFVDSYNKVQHHKTLNKSYSIGLNQFSDMTQEEFEAKHLSKRKLMDSMIDSDQVKTVSFTQEEVKTAPDYINWP